LSTQEDARQITTVDLEATLITPASATAALPTAAFDFMGHGHMDIRCSWPGGPGPFRVVLASITESRTTDAGVPVLGAASCRIENTTPLTGEILFRVQIDWERDIPMRINVALV
jgi:hypothetical protein